MSVEIVALYKHDRDLVEELVELLGVDLGARRNATEQRVDGAPWLTWG